MYAKVCEDVRNDGKVEGEEGRKTKRRDVGWKAVTEEGEERGIMLERERKGFGPHRAVLCSLRQVGRERAEK